MTGDKSSRSVTPGPLQPGQDQVSPGCPGTQEPHPQGHTQDVSWGNSTYNTQTLETSKRYKTEVRCTRRGATGSVSQDSEGGTSGMLSSRGSRGHGFYSDHILLLS